ncbi:MAG: GUN4 domain-containing protein [Cyanobacteria bacterium J06638_22]
MSHSPSPIPQRILNLLIQWMPLGGSGWLFISFLRQQAWAEALIAFPVTLVAAVWAAYTESFVARMREIYAERGRSDADALMKLLERLNQSFTKPDARYLQCQGAECLYNDIEGYRQPNDIKVALLKDVFVPLELSASFSRSVDGDALPFQMGSQSDELLEKQLRGNSLSVWDLLRQAQTNTAYSRLAILAWGGFGKTTLMRHITYTFAHNRHKRYQVPRLIPVLLYLRKWRDVIAQENATDLPTLIRENHIPDLPGGQSLDLPEAWATNVLTHGKGLVMLDGFDEVAEDQRSSVSQWISRQMRAYPKTLFILTSRPGGYDHYSGQERPRRSVFVKPFKPEQWQLFIHQWYRCQEQSNRAESAQNRTAVLAIAENHANDLIDQIEQREELAAMATNPLLLNMIATFHRYYPGNQLPKRRADLYQAICQLQLGARPESKRIEMGVSAADSQQVLQWLALEMGQQKQQTQIEEAMLLRYLREYLTALNETIEPRLFLNRIAQVSELMVEREPQQYEFAHRSFQSYLAAVEIERQQQENWLLEHWDDEWWQETILLYVARVKNPAPLLQGLVDRGAANLSYRCLQETTRRVDPDLVATIEPLATQVKDLRYAQLESYLKNGQWEEADEETYRLMITTVGKEEGQWFEAEELLNFPCEELLAIDGLWVKYSNGQFGFSVQKDIYLSEEVGGVANGLYYKDTWEKFCHKVDWSVRGRYVFVRFDTHGPKGHLPVAGMVGAPRGVPLMLADYYMIIVIPEQIAFLLFSRIQTCGA